METNFSTTFLHKQAFHLKKNKEKNIKNKFMIVENHLLELEKDVKKLKDREKS